MSVPLISTPSRGQQNETSCFLSVLLPCLVPSVHLRVAGIQHLSAAQVAQREAAIATNPCCKPSKQLQPGPSEVITPGPDENQAQRGEDACLGYTVSSWQRWIHSPRRRGIGKSENLKDKLQQHSRLPGSPGPACQFPLLSAQPSLPPPAKLPKGPFSWRHWAGIWG